MYKFLPLSGSSISLFLRWHMFCIFHGKILAEYAPSLVPKISLRPYAKLPFFISLLFVPACFPVLFHVDKCINVYMCMNTEYDFWFNFPMRRLIVRRRAGSKEFEYRAPTNYITFFLFILRVHILNLRLWVG